MPLRGIGVAWGPLRQEEEEGSVHVPELTDPMLHLCPFHLCPPSPVLSCPPCPQMKVPLYRGFDPCSEEGMSQRSSDVSTRVFCAGCRLEQGTGPHSHLSGVQGPSLVCAGCRAPLLSAVGVESARILYWFPQNCPECFLRTQSRQWWLLLQPRGCRCEHGVVAPTLLRVVSVVSCTGRLAGTCS